MRDNVYYVNSSARSRYGFFDDFRTTPTVRRWLTACFRGLLAYELLHDRARRRLLGVVDPDSGASADEVLAAIQTEKSAREFAQWGRPLKTRERLALAGLSTAAVHDEISALIRDDLLRSDPRGFSSSAALRRRACAWIFAMLIVGTMALMFWVLLNGLEFDPWYAILHLVGTGVVAWWFSKDIFASARSAETAVKAANAALRLRELERRKRP